MTTPAAAPTSQSEDVTILISLSLDELAYLLESVNLSGMPGFTIPETYNQYHAEAAMRSLMARDILLPGLNGGLTINGGVATVLNSTLKSGRVLSLTAKSGAESADHWVYLDSGFITHLQSPRPGVYRFQVLDSGLKFAALLIALMNLEINNQVPANQNPVRLPINAYQQARAQAQDGQIKASVQSFTKQGVPSALAQTLAAPQASYTLASLVMTSQGLDQQKGCAVVTDGTATWLIVPESNEVMVIMPMNTESILNHIIEMLRA